MFHRLTVKIQTLCTKSMCSSIASDLFLNAISFAVILQTAHFRRNSRKSLNVLVVQKFAIYTEGGDSATTIHLFGSVYLSSASPIRQNHLLGTVPAGLFFRSNPFRIYLQNLSCTAAIETPCHGTDGTSL